MVRGWVRRFPNFREPDTICGSKQGISHRHQSGEPGPSSDHSTLPRPRRPGPRKQQYIAGTIKTPSKRLSAGSMSGQTRSRCSARRSHIAAAHRCHWCGSLMACGRGHRQEDQVRGQRPEGLVIARGSTLMDLHGIGPSGAARLLADVGDIRRFADRDRFALLERHRTAGRLLRQQQRHRLSRAGNRRINRALHIMAVVQLRNPHRRPRLLRRQEGRREDLDGSHARPQTPTVQRRLRPHARRPETTAGGRPGRALGDDSAIQRDRPDPGHRLFGQATSRTRHHPSLNPWPRPALT